MLVHPGTEGEPDNKDVMKNRASGFVFAMVSSTPSKNKVTPIRRRSYQ